MLINLGAGVEFFLRLTPPPCKKRDVLIVTQSTTTSKQLDFQLNQLLILTNFIGSYEFTATKHRNNMTWDTAILEKLAHDNEMDIEII